MENSFVYSKVLTKDNFKDSFSTENIIYNLLSIARDEIEFHTEIKMVVQNKFLEELQLKMLEFSAKPYLFKFSTEQELEVIWNVLNDTFHTSNDYDDFKKKLQESMKAVILILNKEG